MNLQMVPYYDLKEDTALQMARRMTQLRTLNQRRGQRKPTCKKPKEQKHLIQKTEHKIV